MPAPLQRRAEWSFVRFVRGIYAGEAPDSWMPEHPLRLDQGLARDGASRPMLEHVAPLLAKGTWKFLARNGGYRKRDVVVKGRARSGRVWEEPIWGPEPLRVSGATVLKLSALHDILASGEEAAAVSRAALQASDALLPGDRLALSAALTALFRNAAIGEQLASAAAPLAEKLPAFALSHPRMFPGAAAWKLGEDHESTALQYFDDWMAGAWVAEIQRLRQRTTVAEQGAAYERLSNLVGSLFPLASTPDAAHFLIPVARFFPVLWRDLGKSEGILAIVEKSAATLATRGEREQYEFRVGTLLHHGVRLDERVQQVLATPWPDRTESQKRLVAEHETRYREIRDEVRTLARRLRRELG